MDELLEAVFSMRSSPRLRKESIVRCEFSSEVGRELTDKVVCWQLEVSSARDLSSEGSAGLSQRSEYEAGVRW
jgi:hypothetical protein